MRGASSKRARRRRFGWSSARDASGGRGESGSGRLARRARAAGRRLGRSDGMLEPVDRRRGSGLSQQGEPPDGRRIGPERWGRVCRGVRRVRRVPDCLPGAPDDLPDVPDNDPEASDSYPEAPDDLPDGPDHLPWHPDHYPEHRDNDPESPDSFPRRQDNFPETSDDYPERPDDLPERRDRLSGRPVVIRSAGRDPPGRLAGVPGGSGGPPPSSPAKPRVPARVARTERPFRQPGSRLVTGPAPNVTAARLTPSPPAP